MDTPHICNTTTWYRLVTYADVPIADASVLCPESPDTRWTGSDALACMLAFAKMWCKCDRDSSSEVTILLVRNAQHAWTLCYLASKWQHGWCGLVASVAMLLASLWNPNQSLTAAAMQLQPAIWETETTPQKLPSIAPILTTDEDTHGDGYEARTHAAYPKQSEMTWEWEEHVRRRPRTVQLAIASPNSIIQDRWLGLLPPI